MLKRELSVREHFLLALLFQVELMEKNSKNKNIKMIQQSKTHRGSKIFIGFESPEKNKHKNVLLFLSDENIDIQTKQCF